MDNRMRLVTGKLTPRQLRALTTAARINVSVPRLLVTAKVIPPSAREDLTEALDTVFHACTVTLARFDMPVPPMFGN